MAKDNKGGIDFSKFKHVSSDKNTTRLKHSDGHFLVIANKAIKGPLKAHLDALSADSQPKANPQALGVSAKDAMDTQDRKGYDDGGVVDTLKSYGVQGQADSNEAIRSKEAAAKVNPQASTSNTDVRTPEQKAKAQLVSIANGYKDGGSVIPETPASANDGTYKPQANDPGPYDAPRAQKQSDGTVTPTPRSAEDRVRQAGHDFKQATGATYGNYADGGDVDPKAIAAMQPEVRNARQKAGAIPSQHQMQTTSRQMYANGDIVASTVPNYQDPLQTPAPAPSDTTSIPTQPQTDQSRLHQVYNDRLMGNNKSDPYSLAKGIVPGDNDEMFGPNGEAPKVLNNDVAQKAQQQVAWEKSENAAQGASAQQDVIATNQNRAAMGLPPLPVPDIPNGPQVPGSDMNPPQTQPDSLKAVSPQDPMASSMGDMAGMMQKGYGNEMAGINASTKAAGALGDQQAQLLNQNIQSQQNAQVAYKQQYDELEKERQAHMSDIQQGYIDPQKYWTGDSNGNGSHSRVASAIGMILAGFNPTNKPNAAVDMLKYQMDQNIEAQKQNLGAKQNLLTANLRQFGNLREATDMTRLMQSDIMQNELKTAAAKAASPMAKAAALTAAGQLQMQYAPLQQQMAMRQSMMKLANSGNSDVGATEHMLAYMRMTNPEMAKEMESRYVPGVGMASVPVTPAVRDQLVSHQKLDSIGNDVLNYAKTHTNLVPGTAEYNTGVQKSMILQQAIREGMLGTVFRESEKPLLQKFVDDNPAGAFKTISSEPKIRTILDSNRMQMNLLKKSNGLPSQQATPEAQIPQYKTVNGVKYMRGPDGKAIPIR